MGMCFPSDRNVETASLLALYDWVDAAMESCITMRLK